MTLVVNQRPQGQEHDMTQPILAVASSLQPPGQGVEAFGVSLKYDMTQKIVEGFRSAELCGISRVQIDLRDEVALKTKDFTLLAGTLIEIVRTFFAENPSSRLKSVTFTAQSEFMIQAVVEASTLH